MREALGQLIDKTDMIAWHGFDAASSTNGFIADKSGNGLSLLQATDPPVLIPNAYKENPGWYFEGTGNPLVWSGTIQPKHVFVIAAFEETTFSVNRGLLSGVTTGDWLATDNSGDNRLFTFGPLYDYRKADHPFVDYDWQAPTNLVPLLMEVSHPDGIPMDGIQVGRQRDLVGRDFKGFFFEQFLFSSVRPQHVRDAINEYAAMALRIWRRNSAGYDVWPFDPDVARRLSADKLVLRSTSVNGKVKERGKSKAKTGVDAVFTTRCAEEWDAAFDFWDTHYPGTPFIYRDDAFTPSRDRLLRFISGLGMQQNDYHDIDYAWQAVTENTETSANIVTYNGEPVTYNSELVTYTQNTARGYA